MCELKTYRPVIEWTVQIMRSPVCGSAAIPVAGEGVGAEIIWLPETQEKTCDS